MTSKFLHYFFRSIAGLFVGLCFILGQAQLIPNTDNALDNLADTSLLLENQPNTEIVDPAVTDQAALSASSGDSPTSISGTSSSRIAQGDSSPASGDSDTNTDVSGDTAPETASAFVAFYADNQSDTDAEDTYHQRAVNYILASGANPIFHAGDLMEDGTQNSLDRFNSVTTTMRSTRTFYAALGNNDRKIGDATTPSPLFLGNFLFPNNEQWYSVNVGNLHLVVLDSAFSSGSAAQLSWLQSDLASEASRSRITGVMYHHPTFSSTVVSYLNDNGVDFVITGHNHSYQHAEASGVDYFVCSGQPALGYLTAQIYSTKAVIRAYDNTNTVVEMVEVLDR